LGDDGATGRRTSVDGDGANSADPGLAMGRRAPTPLEPPTMSASRSIPSATLFGIVLALFSGAALPACHAGPSDGDSFVVDVYATGNGSGRVESEELSFSCHFDAGAYTEAKPYPEHVCRGGLFDVGSGGRVRLHAEPDSGSVVSGWSGDCSGDPCEVSFDAGDRYSSVTVRFDLEIQTPVQVVLADSFDVGDRWDFRILASNGAATQLPITSATGGDPGGFRRMEHRIDGIGNIQVFHRYTAAGYTPSSAGAIASLNYSEHRVLFDPPFVGAGVASGFALEQGGQVYTLAFGGYTNLVWQRFERLAITPSDFSPAPGPDFSNDGAPIRFGFVRSNSNTSSGLQRIHHGIDNWRVEIVRR
jgi:hypothetical protein